MVIYLLYALCIALIAEAVLITFIAEIPQPI